jgi:hypothetical protein
LPKKIGANQLQEMAPYTNDCPKKTEPNSVGLKKNVPYKNDSGQKNRNQTVEDKKWHL